MRYFLDFDQNLFLSYILIIYFEELCSKDDKSEVVWAR